MGVNPIGPFAGTVLGHRAPRRRAQGVVDVRNDPTWSLLYWNEIADSDCYLIAREKYGLEEFS